MPLSISIIVVNWNGIKFLPNCLESIVENPPSVAYEIVVVDNASTDGSVDWLKSERAKKMLAGTNFTLIESKENLGFGLGNNLAIERSETPYLFLLNPDTIVKPNAITKLLETLESDESIGLTAPKLLNADGSVQFSVWAFPPTALKFLFEGLKLYHLLPRKVRSRWLLSKHWHYSERVPVKMVSGAAMMVKRRMTDEIGAFDPQFHMYGEDTELCLRIQRNNWLIVFEPEASIVHLGGQSSSQRWGGDVRLKEEEAFLKFQESMLTPFHVARNTSARIFLLLLLRMKHLFSGRKKVVVQDEIFKLQIKAFIRSFRKILKFG